MKGQARMGTVRANRRFYAWYLRERRVHRKRNESAPEAETGARLTEDEQERETEDGQQRVIE